MTPVHPAMKLRFRTGPTHTTIWPCKTSTRRPYLATLIMPPLSTRRHHHLFSKGDEYWVKTDNESGELQDYRVAYVFGVYPLQQLLLPIHNDRLNALSIAWDARNASEGGQRWYHIYEDQEPVTSESPLHWTGVYHNWNSRCAECHSTNVVKATTASAGSTRRPMIKLMLAARRATDPGHATLN